MKFVWMLAGFLSLGLGAIGVVLPLLPTVPFLLLSTFCFSKSSDRLHFWLLNHQTFGPPIADWHDGGVIGRRAKILACGSIMATVLLSLWLSVSSRILIVQLLVLIPVTIFILTRPEHRSSKSGKDHQADPEIHTEP
ncbi:MAG: uncharacterized membrane protein YbaN (DUF454 family) [Paracoccaceae bacterium]|jgi:uncharacterized membrane protein YbaN (DUF454 family)